MLLLAALVACSETPLDDNSLEASAAAPVDEASWEAEGAATFAAGDAEGDWALTVDGVGFELHSASRAPLAELDGRTLRVEVDEVWGNGGASARLLEAGEPVFVASIGDGAEVFGRTVWSYGEAVGKGEVVNEADEPTDVVFHETLVHADDGDVVLLPGEPTRVTIDGAVYRATVVASYKIEPQRGAAKCGPGDMLSVELFRTDAAADEAALERPADRRSAMGGCG